MVGTQSLTKVRCVILVWLSDFASNTHAVKYHCSSKGELVSLACNHISSIWTSQNVWPVIPTLSADRNRHSYHSISLPPRYSQCRPYEGTWDVEKPMVESNMLKLWCFRGVNVARASLITCLDIFQSTFRVIWSTVPSTDSSNRGSCYLIHSTLWDRPVLYPTG
jgi:hypothetical protein